MFFMVVGGTCGVALCFQVLQCCLLRFCDKKEKVNVLQLRTVSVETTDTTIENPIILSIEPNEEDPKN